IRMRIFEPGDHRLAKAESLLGWTLIGLEEFEEAEAMLLRAYECLTTRRGVLGAGPPRVPDTISRIVLLYETWRKPDEAARWRDRVLTSLATSLASGSAPDTAR